VTGLLRVLHSLVFLAVVLTAGSVTWRDDATAIGVSPSIQTDGVVVGLIPEGDRAYPGVPVASTAGAPAIATVVAASDPSPSATSAPVRRPASPEGRPRGRLPDPADAH
jgi:hypothetical protein